MAAAVVVMAALQAEEATQAVLVAPTNLDPFLRHLRAQSTSILLLG